MAREKFNVSVAETLVRHWDLEVHARSKDEAYDLVSEFLDDINSPGIRLRLTRSDMFVVRTGDCRYEDPRPFQLGYEVDIETAPEEVKS